jgi:hypothetical protein
VTVVWRAVDVSKSPVVGHVLGYEADLVDGMMVQTVLNVNSTVNKELAYNATFYCNCLPFFKRKCTVKKG